MGHTMANVYTAQPTSRRQAAPGLGAWFGRVVDRVLLWQERAKGRTELQRLNHRMLQDIGISRVDALREAGKPFWRR